MTDEPGTDVAVVQHQAVNLFHASGPAEVVVKARETADALKGVLVKANLITTIQGREHVQIEGWTLLGTMLGVYPVTVWSRPTLNAEGAPYGWEARVEAVNIDGAVVGAAEAMCSRDESSWRSREDYAIRSMAQTRAASKALRMPLGFVVQMAGFSATPAEEMGHDPTPPDPPTPVDPNAEARAALVAQIKDLPEPDRKLLREWHVANGVPTAILEWTPAQMEAIAAKVGELVAALEAPFEATSTDVTPDDTHGVTHDVPLPPIGIEAEAEGMSLGTVEDCVRWVGNDPERAAAMLPFEEARSGGARKGVIDHCQKTMRLGEAKAALTSRLTEGEIYECSLCGIQPDEGLHFSSAGKLECNDGDECAARRA